MGLESKANSTKNQENPTRTNKLQHEAAKTKVRLRKTIHRQVRIRAKDGICEDVTAQRADFVS